jgi:transglutaminase-like putative cysteine protease
MLFPARLRLVKVWFVTQFAVCVAGCGPSPTPQPQVVRTDPVASISDAANQPGQESWDVFYLGDSRIGYGTTKRGAAPGEAGLVRIEAVIRMKILRYGEATETSMKYSTIETPEGDLQQVTGVAELGGQTMTFQGTIENNALQTTTTAAGKTVRGSIPWVVNYRGFFAIEESLGRRPMEPGERRKLRMLLPVFNQLADVELVAGDLEDVALLDRKQKLLRIESTTTLPDNQKNVDTIWTDPQGQMLKSVNAAMKQTIYRTTRENALQEQSGALLDIGQLTLVKTPQLVDNPHGKGQLRYRVRLDSGDPKQAFVSDDSQQVTPIDAHTADIFVHAIRPDNPPEGKAAAGVPPGDDDRQPNQYLQSDDPRIVKLAAEAAGDEKDPWRSALALERFVHQKITKKNFSQTFATAADVAQTLSGDCTEHAVLLAALARARGIPSRVALGLVYVPSEQAFGFHMWTEVYVGDRWIGVDGTLGQGGLGAGHLKLSTSNLKEGTAMSSFLPVAQVLGRLKIEEVAGE